ncbi:MAG: DUF2330 domain-containing protein [Marinovum sp.]|nr:DUF2330 domain-containing protein [Marinovum sp.]
MLRILGFLFLIAIGAPAQAFCGFYVAKADGSLYNQSSKVVFARKGKRSVITMSSDYRGDPSDFAMVVPTPRVLQEHQIKTVHAETIAHLDSYTAPRLVEYHDYFSCEDQVLLDTPVIVEETASPGLFARRNKTIEQRARAQGVSIKAKYAVGQYDILILKARQSDGLETFLKSEGYKLPDGAEPILADYIAKGMKFFVARVNLSRHAAAEKQELPPLQIRFRSDNFMLPIQLGKLNADKSQDALFFMLSEQGRVDVANYKTMALPTNTNVPVFVEQVFPRFYTDVFNKTVGRGGGIVMEYAWDMSWCDPCAADPLSYKELQELGVTWAKRNAAAQNVYVTRLHAQYTKNQMPKDLVFRETTNRKNFQGRYVMNHPYDGDVTCERGKDYIAKTKKRLRDEAKELAKITGWRPGNINDNIRKTTMRRYWP